MQFMPAGWNVRVLPDFKVYELTLNKGQYVVLAVDGPPELRLDANGLGINTYRANAILNGAIKFSSNKMPGFVRYRGDNTIDTRLTIKDEYRLEAVEDDSKFVCIMAENQLDKLYLMRNLPLGPGQSTILENSDLERNVFIVQGEVKVGTARFTAFKHLRLTKPQEYEFTNTGDTDAFIVYMYEATKEMVKSQLTDLPADQLASVQRLQE